MPMRMTAVPGYRASWFGDLARNRWKLRSIFSLRLDGELKGFADIEGVYTNNCCVVAAWA